MMSREERIEYEILDCILNHRGDEGVSTTVPGFMMRLVALFPGIQVGEFASACRRLLALDALDLSVFDKADGVRRDYRDGRDDVEFFYADPKTKLHLRASAASRAQFTRLAALIELPAAFKRWMGQHGRTY